jgi:hypothetical protein
LVAPANLAVDQALHVIRLRRQLEKRCEVR